MYMRYEYLKENHKELTISKGMHEMDSKHSQRK